MYHKIIIHDLNSWGNGDTNCNKYIQLILKIATLTTVINDTIMKIIHMPLVNDLCKRSEILFVKMK